MKWRSSLALLAVSLGLLGFVWFWDSGRKSTDEAARTAGRLFDFDAPAVQWIELDSNGTTLRFERRSAPPAPAPDSSGDSTAAAPSASPAPPALWRMTRPLDDRADQSLVDSLADRLARFESSRQLGVTDDEGRASVAPPDDQAGLSPPRFAVRFGTGAPAAAASAAPATASTPAPAAAETKSLAIGREIPGSTSVYVRVSGRPGLDVSGRELTEGLDRTVDDWRDRALFDVTTLELGGAEIERPEGTVRFKRADETWRVAAPFDDDAAGSKVQSLLFTVAGLHAVSFASADDPAGLAALLSPPYRITLTRRDGSSAGQVIIGAPVEGSEARLWARSSDRQGLMQVDKALLDTLGGAAETYRSMQAFTIGEYSAAKISLQKGTETLSFEYKDGTWIATAPAGLTPQAGTVEATVNAAAGLQAASFAGPATGLAAWGLDPAAATVTLVSRADEPAAGAAASTPAPARTEVVRLGKPTGTAGQIYAMREGRPVVLAVPDAILARFDRKIYENPPKETVPGAEMSGTAGTHGGS